MLYYFFATVIPIGPITDFVTEQFLDLSYLKASSQSNFVGKNSVRQFISRTGSIITLFAYAELRDWTLNIQIWGGDDTWANNYNFIQIRKEQRVCKLLAAIIWWDLNGL